MNPFGLQPYTTPEYFCDRNDETQRIIGAIKNGRPLTLISIRRLGKTGLIQHVHNQLPKKYLKIYIDINDTSSEEEFANKLIMRAIAQLNGRKKSTLKRAMGLFAQFRATLTLDPVLRIPSLSVEFKTPAEVTHSVHTLFALMEDSGLKIQLAIDEFQRIADYEETTIDATLREVMQANPNLHIIFSGSKKHVLVNLFADVSRPLFGTTEIMHLTKIDYPSYMAYIRYHYENNDKFINDDQIHHLLNWTKMHTFYTQYFCNLLFQLVESEVKEHHIMSVKEQIFRSNESTYYLFRNLLTTPQWNLLTAIAKENELREPTSQVMRQRYKLGASSTVARSLETLLNKEMIYKNVSKAEVSYEVYDVFLSRWLQEK